MNINRRQFLQATGLAGLLKTPTSLPLNQQEEPKYEIYWNEQVHIIERKSGKGLKNESDSDTFGGTAQEIIDEYMHRIIRGKIPDVRHLHDRLEEITELMSRDTHYLANKDASGFEFDGEVYWNPKKDNPYWKQREALEGIPLSYIRSNIFIAGVYYTLRLNLIGKPVEGAAIVIDGLDEVSIAPSTDGNDGVRLDHGWLARPNHELFIERRVLDAERGLLRYVTLDSPLMRAIDPSQKSKPLIEALRRQVVYFDKDWNPINIR